MMILAAASSQSAQSAWFALAGALGGVVLSGITALVSSVLNHRWQSEGQTAAESLDEKKRLREERRTSNIAFLDASDDYYQAAVDLYYHRQENAEGVTWRNSMGNAAGRLQTAYLRLTITNGKPVRERAGDYMMTLEALSRNADQTDRSDFLSGNEKAQLIRDSLRAAMRSELGMED